ncbi:Monoterpene epsilon-lactone hydrolase [subsurface metagenome]
MADVGVFWWIPAYLNGEDPNNPLACPIFADFTGFPSILAQVSTSEMVYDHSTRLVELAKAAGVNAILQEWDDMPHVWQNYGLYDLPEAKEAIDKIGQFIKDLFD